MKTKYLLASAVVVALSFTNAAAFAAAGDYAFEIGRVRMEGR